MYKVNHIFEIMLTEMTFVQTLTEVSFLKKHCTALAELLILSSAFVSAFYTFSSRNIGVWNYKETTK